jgi:hypothetical protein
MFIWDQVPMTRVCAATGISGVAVGAQIACPVISSTGCPFANTRVAPTIHCAVTQGPFAAGGGESAQPATTYGLVSVTTG